MTATAREWAVMWTEADGEQGWWPQRDEAHARETADRVFLNALDSRRCRVVSRTVTYGDWEDAPAPGGSGTSRAGILFAAADKLDHLAHVHGLGVVGVTDLLRVWADQPERWETGS